MHHVSNDLANLSCGSEYGGGKSLQLDDGNCVAISHIGNSHFYPCSESCSRFLFPHNLLLVPHITKDLLSVSKFAFNSDVFF